MYLKEKVIVGLVLILSLAAPPLWAEKAAEKYLNSGNNYFNQGKYDQAIEEYMKGVALEPNNLYLRINLGYVLIEEEKYGLALVEFQKSIQLSPKNIIPYYLLSNIIESKEISEEAKKEYEKKYGNRLRELMGKRNYEPAMKDFQRAIETSANNAIAQYLLGLTYSLSRKKKEATNQYRKAIELAPKWSTPRTSLAMFAFPGDTKDAIAELKKAIEIDPEAIRAHFMLGMLYFRESKWEEAVEELKRVITSQSKDTQIKASAYIFLAQNYEKKGQIDEAITSYKKAMEILPEEEWVYSRLIALYKRKSLLDKAMTEYEETLKENPKDKASHYLLSRIYEEKGMYEEAIRAGKSLMALEPGEAKNYAYLAKIYKKKGDLKKSLAQYKNAIALDSDYAPAYLGLGEVYEKEERYSEALDIYLKVIEKKISYGSGCGPCGCGAGRVENKILRMVKSQNMYQEAVKKVKGLLAKNPENRGLYSLLGALHSGEKKFNKAIASYEKLITLEPNNTRNYQRLGETYFRRGEKKKAIATWQKIIELNPDDAHSYMQVGKIYKRHRLYDEAISAYEKVRQLGNEWSRKWARRELVELYEKTGRLDELAEELEKKLKEE